MRSVVGLRQLKRQEVEEIYIMRSFVTLAE
jgi:hypothetical protein